MALRTQPLKTLVVLYNSQKMATADLPSSHCDLIPTVSPLLLWLPSAQLLSVCCPPLSIPSSAWQSAESFWKATHVTSVPKASPLHCPETQNIYPYGGSTLGPSLPTTVSAPSLQAILAILSPLGYFRNTPDFFCNLLQHQGKYGSYLPLPVFIKYYRSQCPRGLFVKLSETMIPFYKKILRHNYTHALVNFREPQKSAQV